MSLHVQFTSHLRCGDKRPAIKIKEKSNRILCDSEPEPKPEPEPVSEPQLQLWLPTSYKGGIMLPRLTTSFRATLIRHKFARLKPNLCSVSGRCRPKGRQWPVAKAKRHSNKYEYFVASTPTPKPMPTATATLMAMPMPTVSAFTIKQFPLNLVTSLAICYARQQSYVTLCHKFMRQPSPNSGQPVRLVSRSGQQQQSVVH